MTKTNKKFPDLSSMTMSEEVDFWDSADLTDYIDPKQIGKKRLKLQLKPVQPKDELIAFRLEKQDSALLKSAAQDLGIGYSTLLRMLVKKYLKKVEMTGNDPVSVAG